MIRQKTVRGLLDGNPDGETSLSEYVRAEKHLCADCRPDGWVILYAKNAWDEMYDEGEMCINLRASQARDLGHALVQMADELDNRE
jgi:hypothetical protein